ncbi:MAG: ribonuclease D [Rhodospirillaceae bacterium]|nr:ribonuclease D [Rhodospirillaceae bacterium]
MTIISTTKELAKFCESLLSAEFITVDTEFHRETTYWPLLCLTQVAGPNKAVCIDTLADEMDLTPLYDIFSNTNIVKVFHAARQDIEIFFHKTNLIPTPLFDSQVAGMVCGFGDSVGYETLVTRLTDNKIDKSQRFTDWSQRPLSDQQISYALADVTHLRDIYRELKKQLDETQRLSWLKEEMEIITNPKTYTLTPDDAWKRIKSRDKRPRVLSVLKELAAWRERTAQSQNIPRRRIIKDEALVELAILKPETIAEIGRTRLSKHLSRSKFAPELIAAVNIGIQTPDSECPRSPKNAQKPGGLSSTIELLKVLLKARCEDHNVAVKLVATTDDLEKIAVDNYADVPALKGWRRQIFGEDALKLKKGELALSINPTGNSVRTQNI